MLLTPIVGPACAGVSPGKMLCPVGAEVASCASLSGALVATSFSAMVIVVASTLSEPHERKATARSTYVWALLWSSAGLPLTHHVIT
jgi:hypothetical protein